MTSPNPRRTTSKIIKYFFYRVLVLFATLFSIFILTPVIILITIPFGISRKLVSFLARIFNPSLGKILTTASSVFAAENLYTEKSNTISSMNVIKGRVDVQKFSEEFQLKALNRRDLKTNELVYPEFQQNIVRWMGYAFWKNISNFSLSDCIVSYEDSQKFDYLQGDWTYSNVLQRVIPLNSRPWDPQKPLWRLIFLPYNSQKSGTTSSEDTLLIIILHHALADGFSGMKAFFQCMGIDPKEYLGKVNSKNSTSSGLNICSSISYAFCAHYDFMYNMIKSFDSSKWKVDPKLMMNPDFQAFGSYSDPFPLQRLKDIKDKFRVSLSAVVYSILTAGLRRGLLETTCKETADKLPKKLHLVVPLPVPGHPDKLRNHMTVGILSLPVGDPDPISRLYRVHRGFERLKRSPSLLTAIYLQKVMGSFPLRVVSVLRNVTNVSVILTNLPGPPYPLSVCGSPVEDGFICGNANLGSLGIASSFTTYNGTARFTVGGYQSIFPTQQTVDDVLAASMKEVDVLQSIDEV